MQGDDPFTKDVREPSVPAVLGLMVDNRGNGSAKAMRVSSSQPEIVDNEKGLLIDFKLLGTRVDSAPLGEALQNVPLGSLQPHTTRVVQWYLASSLAGVFTSFKVEMEHTSPLGNTQLSLVDTIATHTLIHVVRLPGGADDGKPDFVIKGEPAPSDHAVYDSRNPSQPLLLQQATGTFASVNGQLRAVAPVLTGGSRLVRLANTLPVGAEIVVSHVDGSTIPSENVWFERRTIRYEQSTEEINDIYIFDYRPDPSGGGGNVTYMINITTTSMSTTVPGADGSQTTTPTTGTAVVFTTPPSFEFTPVTSSATWTSTTGDTTMLSSDSSATSNDGAVGTLSTPSLTTTTSPQRETNAEQSSQFPVWIVVVLILLVVLIVFLGLVWQTGAAVKPQWPREARSIQAICL